MFWWSQWHHFENPFSEAHCFLEGDLHCWVPLGALTSMGKTRGQDLGNKIAVTKKMFTDVAAMKTQVRAAILQPYDVSM